MRTKDVGTITAYGYACDYGELDPREVSEQEFGERLASYMTVAQEAADSAGRAAEAANAAGQILGSTNLACDEAIRAKNDAVSAKDTAAEAANVAGRYESQAQAAKTDAESARDTAVNAVDGFAAGAQQALDSVNEAGGNWKSLAEKQAGNSEAWAVGQRDGEDVGSSDPAYHNNAKWYALTAATDATTASDAAQTATAKASEAQISASAAAESARTLTIDATLTQSGQAADAKKTGNEITRLKEDLNAVYDVALGENGISATLKYAVFTSQKITHWDTGAYTIACIPCEPDKSYHITKDIDTTKFDIAYATETLALNTPVYGFVSLQGTVREAVYIPGAGATFLLVQTQGNASHVVFSKYVGKYDNDIVSINETLNDITNITNSITRTEYTGETDVLSDGVMTADYYFGISGNQAGPCVGVWEYITFDVSKGDTYSVTATAGQLARLWLLLDTSNHVVSYSQDSSAISIKGEIIVIPDGVAKMVVNARIETVKDRNSLAVVKLSTGVKIAPDAITSNILAGKILCCAGDSITYGADMDAEGITNISNIDVYQSNSSGEFTKKTNQFLKSWGFQIAERNGMTFYNAGVSGSTMQGISEKNGFSLANGRYTKLPDNIDYLLIWFGWNDRAYGSLGAITDTTNESYYGGYNVVMPYLIDKYPYTKIALIVPFGTDANHRNAIRQLGNKWGVAVWDNYQGGTPLYYGKEPSVGVEQSIVTANQAKFQANGAHPNYKGHTQLADMIEQFLRGI